MSQAQGSIEIILCDRRFCRAVCQRPTKPFEKPFWCANCERKFVRAVPSTKWAADRQAYAREVALTPMEPDEDFE